MSISMFNSISNIFDFHDGLSYSLLTEKIKRMIKMTYLEWKTLADKVSIDLSLKENQIAVFRK